jgi:hypothetical protein
MGWLNFMLLEVVVGVPVGPVPRDISQQGSELESPLFLSSVLGYLMCCPCNIQLVLDWGTRTWGDSSSLLVRDQVLKRFLYSDDQGCNQGIPYGEVDKGIVGGDGYEIG